MAPPDRQLREREREMEREGDLFTYVR